MDETVFHPPRVWLLEQVSKQDWKLVAFTRINPIFPTAALNYFWSYHDKVLALPAGDSDIYLSHDLVFLIFGRLGWRFCS